MFYIFQLTRKEKYANYGGAVFISLINIVWNIFPIFYSLYSNHNVFKKVAEQMNQSFTSTFYTKTFDSTSYATAFSNQ